MDLANLLKDSNYTVFFTGAGMSTESGLPDFRSSNNGLWNQKDSQRIASTEALNKNVDEFVQFYRERVLGVKEHAPHNGHYLLAKWEKAGMVKSIITQNVDGFHQAAGSEDVIELHGTLQQVHCQSCHKIYDSKNYLTEEYKCECRGILRPSVILFGEALPERAFLKAEAESEKADLFIVLGSSLTVTPANQFPLLAKQAGAKLVIINKEPTPFDFYADLTYHNCMIGDILAQLDSNL